MLTTRLALPNTKMEDCLDQEDWVTLLLSSCAVVEEAVELAVDHRSPASRASSPAAKEAVPAAVGQGEFSMLLAEELVLVGCSNQYLEVQIFTYTTLYTIQYSMSDLRWYEHSL